MFCQRTSIAEESASNRPHIRSDLFRGEQQLLERMLLVGQTGGACTELSRSR